MNEGRDDFAFSTQDTVIDWPSSSIDLGNPNCKLFRYSISIFDLSEEIK